MWNFLDKASECGRSFKKDLDKSDGFALTRWFDGLSSSVKPVCFALAMAAGASGFSAAAMASEHDHIATDISIVEISTGDIFQEARQIEKMTPQSIAEFAYQRRAENPDGLRSVSVVELSRSIVNNGFEVDLGGGGVALENPYISGQTVPVYETDDLSAHLKLLMTGKSNFSVVNAAMKLNSPFAIQPNYFNKSLDQQQKQTVIMLPDKLPAQKWTGGVKPEQDVAFVLYHELAHAHLMQIVSPYASMLDQKAAGQMIDHSLFVEAHADTTAALMVGKAFDIAADELREILRANSEIATQGFITGETLGHDDYRGQKAFAVIDKMLEEDPGFLQKIDESLVPVLAYDIVNQAGYYHNKADAVMHATIEGLPKHATESAIQYDVALHNQLSKGFPDNLELNDKSNQLMTLWREYVAGVTIDRLASQIEESLSGLVVEGDARRNLAVVEQFGLQYANQNPSLARDINERIRSVRSGEVSLKDGLQSLAHSLRETGKHTPTLDEVDGERNLILSDITDELSYISAHLMARDATSSAAIGLAESPDDIAANLIDRYNLNQFSGDRQSLYAGPVD